MDDRLDQIINLLTQIEQHLNPTKNTRTPMFNQDVLDAAEFYTGHFTLESLKTRIPPNKRPTDKVIGSTLIHNGYGKTQQRINGARQWYYIRRTVNNR